MKLRRIKMVLLLTAVLAVTGLTGCTNSKAKENQDAYKTIGITAMEQGNYDEAIEAFQNALDQSLAVVSDAEVDICYYKAMAQYEAGYTEDAFATYTALLEYDDEDAKAYYLRGNLYLDQGDKDSALADYEQAVENNSRDIEMYVSIYENLAGAGYETDGTEILKKAIEISGSKADDYAGRGRAYTLLGDYDSAAAELDKAVEEGSTEALFYKAQLLDLQGNAEEAKTFYENYIAVNEDDPDALNTLGCIAMKNSDYTGALSYFEKALAAAEESGFAEKEIRKNQILAYEYNEQFEEAKAAMEAYKAEYTLDEEMQREDLFLQTR